MTTVTIVAALCWLLLRLIVFRVLTRRRLKNRDKERAKKLVADLLEGAAEFIRQLILG